MTRLRKSSMKLSVIALGFLGNWLAIQIPAQAQDYGDPVQGAIQTQRVCSTCHGVARGEASRNAAAPNFNDIASIEGMSGTALNVALLTPHHQMPNLILSAQERADVIAFILGLRMAPDR